MSDFEILKALMSEYISTLERRRAIVHFIPRNASRTKLKRLRIEIGDIMHRIEQKCDSAYKNGKEEWEEQVCGSIHTGDIDL